MNWPDNLLDIRCDDAMSASFLPDIVKGWGGAHIKMDQGAIRQSSTEISWTFSFHGHRYQIDCRESSEMRSDGRLWWDVAPYRLRAIGVAEGEEHSAPATDFIVTDEIPLSPACRYEGVWGSF